MANPVLESFGESPKACVTNSSRPPANLKGKGNPYLPLVFSNYWPPIVDLSLCFNHLVLSTFRQCKSAIPQRSTTKYSILREKKTAVEIYDKRTNFYFNVITHTCPFSIGLFSFLSSICFYLLKLDCGPFWISSKFYL